jgi:hypothetical protein
MEKQLPLLEQAGKCTSDFVCCFGEEKNLLPLQRIEPSLLSFQALGVVAIPTAFSFYFLLLL